MQCIQNAIVTRYNAKPFLARTSSSFYHEPGKYFAVDIDAHLFGKLARKSLGYLRDCLETVIFGENNEKLGSKTMTVIDRNDAMSNNSNDKLHVIQKHSIMVEA